jgi:hypothetical protein
MSAKFTRQLFALQIHVPIQYASSEDGASECAPNLFGRHLAWLSYSICWSSWGIVLLHLSTDTGQDSFG